jgi:predicted TIM-barrel fold metal-dependent hydrolase
LSAPIRTPVVDAHHHFWTLSRHDYYWMAGAELDPIRRSFEPADLRPHLTEAGVDYTVLVQTVPSVQETREFMETAAATSFVAGVVGWVDLTDPAVGDTLAARAYDLELGALDGAAAIDAFAARVAAVADGETGAPAGSRQAGQ